MIQELIATALREEQNTNVRAVAVQAISRAGISPTPNAWLEGMTTVLTNSQGTVLSRAVTTSRQLSLPKGGFAPLTAALLGVSRRDSLPWELRLDALLAAGPGIELSAGQFAELCRSVLPEEASGIRSAASTVLGTAQLSAQQRLDLIPLLKRVGPWELPKLLATFEQVHDAATGEALITNVRESLGRDGLRAEQITKTLAKYPEAVQAAGRQLAEEIDGNTITQAAELEKIAAELPTGDVRRGHEIFFGKKATCIACHALGYHGGRLGPDLTSIGRVRTERDLLESIVFPSASFVRSFEPVTIETEDGLIVNGNMISETQTEIVIALDALRTQTISRKEIAKMRPSRVSLMPPGMAKVLTRQEIADLIAFLKSPQR